jgi:hypothetical protein
VLRRIDVRNFPRLVLISLLAALAAAGCAAGTGTTDPSASQSAPPASPSTGPSVVPSPPSPSTPDPGQVLVSYLRQGGIAGFRDELVVRPDGSYTVTGRNRSAVNGKLTPAELAELRRALQDANFAGLPTDSPLQIADGFTHVIRYGGRQVSAGDGNVPKTLAPVISLLDKIIRQAG